ncbi:hypothetical protein evm_014961 [Chilo suppressalis]|nr:hypothetical protein evm_014961 [Chilo suppressalis]
MNCLEEDIRYEIKLFPKHGSIEVGEGQGSGSFTQLDVATGRVLYRHREPGTLADQVRFKVTCLETWGEGTYPVKIYPSSYWQPLRVASCLPLAVEESTSVNVTRAVLEPINIPTAGAQAFPMDGMGRLGHDPPRIPNATADAAGTNS